MSDIKIRCSLRNQALKDIREAALSNKNGMTEKFIDFGLHWHWPGLNNLSDEQIIYLTEVIFGYGHQNSKNLRHDLEKGKFFLSLRRLYIPTINGMRKITREWYWR